MKRIIGTILIGIVLLIIGINFRISQVIRTKLTAYVKENCSTCQLEIDRIFTDTVFSQVTFKNVHFSSGSPQPALINTRLPLLKLNVNRLDLFRTPHLNKVIVQGIEVDVLEG